MSADLDRFDRLLLGVPPARPAALRTTAASFIARATAPTAPAAPAEREPVITSKRPPRFVDHATCPMCGIDRLGVEFHGELRSGAKVHQLAAHTANMRRVDTKQPRCLGSSMRMEFVDGNWRGYVRVVEAAP